MFLVNVLDRDAIVGQLCSVIVPPIFLYAVIMHFFSEKLAVRLLHKDSYNKKKIKVRMYGILRVTGICLFLICLIVYFAFYKAWDMVVFWAAVLSGYAWIKLSTYSAHLEYTYRYLVFCTGKKRESFPWKDVTQISWVSQRGTFAYVLKIQLSSGLTTNLSSGDFVGLVKMKTFYDEGRYKS